MVPSHRYYVMPSTQWHPTRWTTWAPSEDAMTSSAHIVACGELYSPQVGMQTLQGRRGHLRGEESRCCLTL